jgi:hypothetical protein
MTTAEALVDKDSRLRANSAHRLDRVYVEISRASEYLSVRELQLLPSP